MTGVTDAPRALRGALVAVDESNPVASTVVFQYNPEEMTRRLRARSAAGADGDPYGGARDEALRLEGAPIETISLAVELDANDRAAAEDPAAALLGVYPQLSALETMLYPKSATVLANNALELLGTIEVVPPRAPLTLFVWGPGRVLPVRLSDFSIVEQAYDADLTPLRARVDLELRVLSYNDLPVTDPGYHLFLVHQVAKEALAVLGSVSVPLRLGASAAGAAATGGSTAGAAR
ncbi:hypothetical protein ACIPSJ_30595 [Streptomyces sp. NPDC090088]|uniref:hypothetical protein n=1 Tax=Streptomyces sp. NPDC090088 TaxID=3365944 RepID=UPI003807885E